MVAAVRQVTNSSYGSGAPELTFSAVANPTDIIVIAHARVSSSSAPTSLPVGLGADFELVYSHPNGYFDFWVGRNPDPVTGTVTCSVGGGKTGTSSRFVGWIVSGVVGQSVVSVAATAGTGTTLAGTSYMAQDGQFLAAASAPGSSLIMAGLLPSSAKWTRSDPTTTGTSEWGYACPDESVSTQYQVGVTAGSSANLNLATLIIGMPPPNSPTDLVVDEVTDSTVELSWTPPSSGTEVLSYDYRIDGGGITNVGNVTNYTIAGLAYDTEYDIEIRSVNGGGSSAWVPVTATTLPTVPLPPENLVLTDTESDSLSFGWEPPSSMSPPSSYEQRVEGGAPSDLGNVLSATAESLEPETMYTYEVRSVNSAGSSSWVGMEAMTSSAPAGPAEMVWDANDDRYYSTGVDRGVLYSEEGTVPWNGIIGVTESGAGEKSVLYRDGHIFYSDVEPGDFEGSLNAFFWPPQFSKCLGMPEIAPGLHIDYQKPRHFGLSYRSLIGSGSSGDMFGYQIHVIYNAIASAGMRTRKTKTNSPTLDEFSFELVATPVRVRGYRPSAHFIIDSRNLDPAVLSQLEAQLYGHDGVPGALPDPTWLYDLLKFGSAITFVDHGDGTWTASGSSANLVDNGDGTISIFNVNGVDHGDETYTLSDTP